MYHITWDATFIKFLTINSVSGGNNAGSDRTAVQKYRIKNAIYSASILFFDQSLRLPIAVVTDMAVFFFFSINGGAVSSRILLSLNRSVGK